MNTLSGFSPASCPFLCPCPLRSLLRTIPSKIALFLCTVTFCSAEITTQTLNLTTVRTSKSQRVYLLSSETLDRLEEGRIILIKDGGQNAMGLKIIKLYPEKKQIAARRVSLYPGYDELQIAKNYAGLVKIDSDQLEPSTKALTDSPEDTLKDKTDLDELETTLNSESESPLPIDTRVPEILAYDPELDAGTSPPPDDGSYTGSDRDEKEDDQISHLVADEVRPLDTANQWASVQFAFLLNQSSRRNYTYFSGAGGRYSLTLGKMLFMRSVNSQDSLSLELGAFAFKVIRFMTDFDSYFVLPLVPTLRYNMYFGENWVWYFYLGARYNIILSSTDSTVTGLKKLNTLIPAIGTGLMVQFGPKWFARADFGLEMIAFGLTLKF